MLVNFCASHGCFSTQSVPCITLNFPVHWHSFLMNDRFFQQVFAIINYLYLSGTFVTTCSKTNSFTDRLLCVVQPGQVEPSLCKYPLCEHQTSRILISSLLSLSFPAHWLHGDTIVLQLNRGPAAPLVGQRSKVLRPAQLPRWHGPVAGDAILPPVSVSTVQCSWWGSDSIDVKEDVWGNPVVFVELTTPTLRYVKQNECCK